MKKMMKNTSMLCILLVLAFAICACGGSKPANLEEYLEKHSDQKEEVLNSLVQDNESVSVTGKIEGNNIIIEGTLKETYDQSYLDIMVPMFDAQVETFEETFKSVKETIEENADISADEIHIQVIYYNGDGTEIWNHTF